MKISAGIGLKARQELGISLPTDDIGNVVAPTPSYEFPKFPTDVTGALSGALTGFNPVTDNSTEVTNSTEVANEGLNYVNLTTHDGKYALTSSDTGSLYLTDVSSSNTPIPGTLFASSNDLIVSDYSDRLFHVYQPEIAAYNVSRLRVSTFDRMPQTSRLVNLAPIDHDNNPATSSVAVAVDTLGSYYFIVLCNFDGEADKMFAVSDVENGVSALESADLRFTVTGGVVTSCGPIALGAPVALGLGSEKLVESMR